MCLPLLLPLLLALPAQDGGGAGGSPEVPNVPTTQGALASDPDSETRLPQAAPSGWRYANGIQWESPTSDWRVRFNGRLYLDSVWSNAGNDSAIRSLRLQGRVWFGEHWFLRTQGDFSDNDLDYKELYLEGWWNEDLGVRLGQFREPQGLDGLTPLPAAMFPERAAPSQAFAPGRNPGGMVMFGAGPVRGALGSFGAAEEAVQGDGSSRAVTGRLWGMPIRDEAENRGLHVGLTVGHRDANDGALRFRARPGSNLLDRTIDTGDLPGAQDTTFGLEALWLDGPRNLQAEWLGSHVELADGAGRGDLWGAYLQGGWILTGEEREIDPINGWLRRLRPREGGTAWELAARVAYTDLDGGALSGGEQLDLAAGLNLTLARRVRVMLHLQETHVRDARDVTMALIRIDVGF